MAKHNDKEFTETIRENIRKTLQQQLNTGIAQGMYAACKVVCDKATSGEGEKTPEARLQEIIDFCKPIVDEVDSRARKADA